MARTVGKLDDILLAVKRRLIAEIDECNESTCYLCLDSDENPNPNPGKRFYAIAPLSGEFDLAYFDGGSLNQATVNTGFIVRVYSAIKLDQAGRDSNFLTHEALGILKYTRRVLKKLAGWSPQDEDEENEITRDPLIPSGFVIHKPKKGLGCIDIEFKLCFDWDLVSLDSDEEDE